MNRPDPLDKPPAMDDARVMPPPTDLIGSAESCRILGDVNRTTLTRWVAEGRLAAATKLPGANGAFLFHRAEVERLARERSAA